MIQQGQHIVSIMSFAFCSYSSFFLLLFLLATWHFIITSKLGVLGQHAALLVLLFSSSFPFPMAGINHFDARQAKRKKRKEKIGYFINVYCTISILVSG